MIELGRMERMESQMEKQSIESSRISVTSFPLFRLCAIPQTLPEAGQEMLPWGVREPVDRGNGNEELSHCYGRSPHTGKGYEAIFQSGSMHQTGVSEHLLHRVFYRSSTSFNFPEKAKLERFLSEIPIRPRRPELVTLKRVGRDRNEL